jgi:hypothetical protein
MKRASVCLTDGPAQNVAPGLAIAPTAVDRPPEQVVRQPRSLDGDDQDEKQAND